MLGSNNFCPPKIEDWDSKDVSDIESTPIKSIKSTINQNRDHPRGNQRNWNNLKSQQLGKDFEMQNKTCYKCGSFEHLKLLLLRETREKLVKGSASLDYEPKHISGEGSNVNGVSVTFKNYQYMYTRQTQVQYMAGSQRELILSLFVQIYEPYGGGYVLLDIRWWKINGKGTIKTGCCLKKTLSLIKFNCLMLKASVTESSYGIEDALGHLNFFKTMHKLVRNNIGYRCDNGGEFRNKEMDDFCSRKGIKRDFCNARMPQQNGVAKRRNKTLIEAARTMLADAKLPVTFWAEAVNTACYVQNRVLVTKPLNKTPYELFNGRAPAIGFLRPFGCHVMILNTLDHLGKFDAKGDEGFFVGYSLNSKAFKVYNKRTKL
ncbi:retrovirus-related pol polyprotein from transposon TNT 1-94 [Tanacetum coccineum]|uniref:Retrovirus-related pol polyprotein from transposon TNT 1-94 n=1 Tax=Tanacetum coccineum TaxID=301880 RepID=A0ABQ4YT58_9ASTR